MDITDEIVIDAPAARVWDLTVGIESWPALTPTMTRVERLDEGPLAPGSTARIKQPRQRPRVWTVARCDPPTDTATGTFEWGTRLAWLTLTATHLVEPVDADTTRNTATVRLEGRAAGLASRLLGRPIGRAIAAENRGFATAAEGATG